MVGQNTTAFVCGRAAANLVPRHSRHRSFPSSVTSPALLVVSLVKPDPMSVFDEGSGDNQTGVAPTPPHPCHTVLDVCCDGVWVTSVDKALGWIPGTQLSRAIPQFGSAMDLDSVCSPGETLPPVFCPRPGNRYDGFSILRHCDGACHRDAQPPAANVRSRQLTRPPRRRRVNKGDKVAGTVFRIIRSGVLVQLDTGEKVRQAQLAWWFRALCLALAHHVRAVGGCAGFGVHTRCAARVWCPFLGAGRRCT